MTKKHLNPSSVVLDYGCATGSIALEIASMAKEVHGIDISSNMIEIAKSKADARNIKNIGFAQAAIFDESLGKESFDVILSLSILHLVEDSAQVMDRVSQLLKPGGIFIFATPCLGEKTFLSVLMNIPIFLLSRVGVIPSITFFSATSLTVAITHAGYQMKEPIDVEGMIKSQKEMYAAAWSRFVSSHPGQASSMQQKLQENARRARLREKVRSEYVRDRWLTRLFALRVGTVSGIGHDAFFLTLEEVQALLSGYNAPLSNSAARKAIRRQLMTLPAYPTIIHGSFDPFKWSADPNRRSDVYDVNALSADHESKLITGSPGSAGKVEGIIRIIENPTDGDNLQTGEILVAVQTDIAWTLLFPRAAAVITDVGAALSHAAIVARELGIPAVVGCGNATTRLKTGDRVRVDGAKGQIEII